MLPAVTLGTASAAALARLTRSSVLEIIRQDYVRSARAKGLAERVVIVRHVLKNAVNPIITVLGMQVGYLLGGAILTETVFSWPGLGSMMVRAIQARDYPLVQGGRAADRHDVRGGEPARRSALRGLRPAHPL